MGQDERGSRFDVLRATMLDDAERARLKSQLAAQLRAERPDMTDEQIEASWRQAASTLGFAD